MEQLMDKLMKAKAIMDMTDTSSPSKQKQPPRSVVNEDYDIPNVKYNIPKEFLSEQPSSGQPYLSQVPNTKPVGVPTVDAIKNSKLPDEIKKLMLEHPISQPQQQQTTLSSELIERATRLMKNGSEDIKSESVQEKTNSNVSSNLDYKVIQKMIKDAVNEALRENGLVTESTEKSNETFSFKVGKHLFEGKVIKIKKLS